MPGPATPPKWMRRTEAGSTSARTSPSSPGPASGGKAERLHHRVVEARAELADPRLGAARGRAVGAEGDDEPPPQVDPEADPGEAEVAGRAGRDLADVPAGGGAGGRVAGGARVEAEGARAAGRPGGPH